MGAVCPVTLRCAQNFSVMRVPLSCAIHYSSHSDHWALEIRPVGPKTWSKFQLIQQPRVAYGCHSKQHGIRKLGQVRKAPSPLGSPVSFSVLGEPLGGQAESWVLGKQGWTCSKVRFSETFRIQVAFWRWQRTASESRSSDGNKIFSAPTVSLRKPLWCYPNPQHSPLEGGSPISMLFHVAKVWWQKIKTGRPEVGGLHVWASRAVLSTTGREMARVGVNRWSTFAGKSAHAHISLLIWNCDRLLSANFKQRWIQIFFTLSYDKC